MIDATATGADRLLEPWFSCLKEQLPGLRIFDCHTHLGCADPDGSRFDGGELQAALEVLDARAVVFPLAESGSYREANDRRLAAAHAADGRLVPFCRVDPRNGGLEEARRAVEHGRGPRVPGIHLIFAAAAIARTPGLPLP